MDYNNTIISEINHPNKMEILSPQLSNKTTYMAFIRTGLAITAVSLVFEKFHIILLGIVIIILGTIEYYVIEYQLINGTEVNITIFEFIPIFLTIFILLIFYIESNNIKKK
jgi:uncharacterized membrane protein YidH (DUF202 family)